MNWRNWSSFPKANGQWQVLHPLTCRFVEGRERVNRAVSKLHTFSPLLATSPDSSCFMPPICIPLLQEKAIRSMQRQRKFQIIYVFVFLIFLLVLFLWQEEADQKLLNLILVLSLVQIFFLADYYWVFRDPIALRERSQYISSLVFHKSTLLKLSACLLVLTGGLQILAQQSLEGLEPLIRQYGLMADFPLPTEWWRLLFGPFIHSGYLHWLGNFSFLLLTLGLSGTFLKHPLPTFLMLCVFSALWFRLVPYPARPEAMVGISGGIFGLFGLTLYHTLVHRDVFPRYFYRTLSAFVLMMLLFSLILTDRSSEFAHVTGLITGFFVGLLMDIKRIKVFALKP